MPTTADTVPGPGMYEPYANEASGPACSMAGRVTPQQGRLCSCVAASRQQDLMLFGLFSRFDARPRRIRPTLQRESRTCVFAWSSADRVDRCPSFAVKHSAPLKFVSKRIPSKTGMQKSHHVLVFTGDSPGPGYYDMPADPDGPSFSMAARLPAKQGAFLCRL